MGRGRAHPQTMKMPRHSQLERLGHRVILDTPEAA
jgi:hypothetical protein